jgi:TonB family protein
LNADRAPQLKAAVMPRFPARAASMTKYNFNKAMLIIILFSLLQFFMSSAFPTQSPASAGVGKTESTWKRFTGDGEEFSVLMPGAPSLYFNIITSSYGKRRLERIYGSYSKGSVYLVVSYDGSSIKDTLESFKAHHLYHGELSLKGDITLDGYVGKEYKLKYGEVAGTMQIHATKKHVYAVAIIQAKDDPPLTEYFFSSLSFTPNPGLQRLPSHGPPLNPASNLPQADKTEGPFSGKDVTRKAIVVSKPEPLYSDEARQTGLNGTVVVHAVLSSSGEVTIKEVVRGLPRGLTENAIEAARNIKFIPAVKDGQFVSQYVQLEYNFNVY